MNFLNLFLSLTVLSLAQVVLADSAQISNSALQKEEKELTDVFLNAPRSSIGIEREYACGQSSNAWLPVYMKASKDVWLSRAENCTAIRISGQNVIYRAYHKYLSDFTVGTEIIIDPTYSQWLREEYVAQHDKDLPYVLVGTREELIAFFKIHKNSIAATFWYRSHPAIVDNVEEWVDKTYSLGKQNIYRAQYSGDGVAPIFRQDMQQYKFNCGEDPTLEEKQ